jgi:large subunit ribosomal protein L22
MTSDNIVKAKATLKGIKTSPQKLNIVASMIRGLSINEARGALFLSRKRVAREALKVLDSAIANAENMYRANDLFWYVKEAYVGKNMVLKRFHPRGRGRGARVKKHFSNLSIIVAERG